MSTRGLFGFIEDGNYTANYNHSDSYPGGLGAEFLTACKNGDFSGFEVVEDRIDFLLDSLFCEWAYFYDKDKKLFEIWRGFQKVPDPENFFGQKDRDGYYPCKRIFSGGINTINSSHLKDTATLDAFIISSRRDSKISKIIN